MNIDIEHVNIPIFIKDKYNKIIFINKSFQKNITDKYSEQEGEYLNKFCNEDNNGLHRIGDKTYKKVMIYNDENLSNKTYMLDDVSELFYKNNQIDEKSILRIVIDNIPELIFYKDKDLNYVGMNKECEKFFSERGVKEVIGKKDIELNLDEKFTKQCTEHDKMVLKSKKPLYIEEEIPIENSDDYGVVHTIKTPVINEDGSLWGLVGIVRDITKQKKIENKLRYLSYTDMLTNLYNRAYFEEKISQFIKEKRYPIGVIIGDINGLKIVNDTFGHLEGDRLLQEISKILKQVGKDKGLVFRWGGDEFITLLPNCNKMDCVNFINEVTDICNEKTYDTFKLSISQGYSLIDENNSLDESLREAEDQVYKKKILDKKSIRASMLDRLKRTLQKKDVETNGHIKRMTKYSIEVGKKLGLEEEELEELILVAKLHDIGKVGIPEKILLKPGKLTEDEYEIMKTHSEKGYRLALLLPEISHVSRGILTHHERWDGKGYPLGLKGEEIPIVSRIIAISDAFDAMTSSRIYRNTISINEAIKEIKENSGTQFDPNIVKVFCDIMEKN